MARDARLRAVIVAKKDLAVASSQDQGSAQSGRSAADDNHINFHAEHLPSNSYGTFPKAGNPLHLFVR